MRELTENKKTFRYGETLTPNVRAASASRLVILCTGCGEEKTVKAFGESRQTKIAGCDLRKSRR